MFLAFIKDCYCSKFMILCCTCKFGLFSYQYIKLTFLHALSSKKYQYLHHGIFQCTVTSNIFSKMNEVVILCCRRVILDSWFYDIKGVFILFQRLITERDSLKETNEELKCSQFAGGSFVSGTTLLAETVPGNMVPPEIRYQKVIFYNSNYIY
jgi:hypothetical protein